MLRVKRSRKPMVISLFATSLSFMIVAGGSFAQVATISPDTAITIPGGFANFNIVYDDQGDTTQLLKGYDIKLTFNPSIVGLNTASSGGFLGANKFFSWDTLGTDTAWVVEARLDTGGVTGSGTLTTVTFEGISEGIDTIAFAYAAFRDNSNNPIAVTTTDISIIIVDGTNPTMESIVESQGQYYNVAPTFSNLGFDDNVGLDDGFYQMDSTTGTWTALFTDVSGTSWDSAGWAIPGFGALSEGSHTIYFMATDDAGNQEGESGEWSWQFYKDVSVPSMESIIEAEGQYYNTAPSFSNFGFDDNLALDDGFYQMDSTTGTWTVLFTDVSGTSWDSAGWAIPGFGALSEGSHTIYFMATDDAGNQEGESGEWSWQFYKDTTAPGNVTGFTAEPGHNKVSLSWTNPVGVFEGILIRRVGWNDYPQYDTIAPNYPDSPTADDSVAFVSALQTTWVDSNLSRDIYYYTAFTRDSAGNYSSADTAAQDRATSYWLGDVTDTSGTVGNYDGYIDFEDLMILSGCFSTSEGDASWEPEFDIGPTDDNSRRGIPEPDNVIDFEDLMIFAMNYWMVGPFAHSAVSGPEEDLYVELELPTAELLIGEEFETKLIVNNGADLVKGMHLVLDFDSNSLEFIGVQESDLLKSQEAKVFFKATNAKGKLDISMAVLGTGVTLAESGEIAILKFKLLSNQVTEINLSSVDLRSSENRKLQCSFGNTGVVGIGRSLPKAYALHQNYPNPFNALTDINYQIPKNSRVILQVYDLAGQLVRTLMDKTQTAGYYIVHWDGKDRTGNDVAPGVYFCRLTLQPVHDEYIEIGTASSHSFIRKMILVR